MGTKETIHLLELDDCCESHLWADGRKVSKIGEPVLLCTTDRLC